MCGKSNKMSDIEIWYADESNIGDSFMGDSCSLDKNCDKNEYLELLIAEVFQRETLWNSSLPYKFRSSSEAKLLWTEIDTYLGTPLGTSQAKWKNLRDRFVKEHALQSAYIPSGSAAVKKKSNWPLYESLLFLAPTISYRKTKSNIENVNPQINVQSFQQNKESTNTNKETHDTMREAISKQNLLQQSLLKPQSQSKQTSCNRPNSANLDIETIRGIKRSNSARSTPDTSDMDCQSPVAAKRIKKSRLENTDTHIEEVILEELRQTKPRNEPLHKPDKIETFTKYVEACLRGMIPDVSKRVINKILNLLLEEDM